MGEIIYKDSAYLKHHYAFNEYGQVTHISKAQKLLNGKKCRYFLDEKLTDEILLRKGEVYQPHFALKPNPIEWNGKKYFRDSHGESPEHYDAKLKIIQQGYFEWDDYKILVQECRMEKRFGQTKFRTDLMAKLRSGEEVYIEIIKTSDLSKSKENYIVSNQLPTFKIYIDEKGNFINERFDFIGNSEIERIRERNRTLQFERKESIGRRRIAWSVYYSIKERGEREIEEYKNKVDKEIQGYFETIQQRIKIQSIKKNSITQKIREGVKDSRSLQNKFRKELNYRHGFILENIRQYRIERARVQEVKSRIDSIKAITNEIQRMESLFVSLAPLVKWEWIEPRSTQEPQGKDRLLQLKYLLT